MGGYLLTNCINHKFLVKVGPFTAAKTSDMYDHLQSTLRDFDPDLFIVHVGTNDAPLNKTNNEVAEDNGKLAESIKTNIENDAVSNIIAKRI